MAQTKEMIDENDRYHDNQTIKRANMDIGTQVEVKFTGEIIGKYKKGNDIFYEVRYIVEPGVSVWADCPAQYLTDSGEMLEDMKKRYTNTRPIQE